MSYAGPPPNPYQAGPSQHAIQPTQPSGTISGRVIAGLLLVLAGVALALVASGVLHSSPKVTFEGYSTESDGSSGPPVTVELHCQAVAAGTDGSGPSIIPGDALPESRGISRGSSDDGLEVGDINLLCDRARDARIATAIQTGLGSMPLLLGGMLVLARRPRVAVGS